MVLFEQHYRGDLWRLEVSDHGGRRFANWRRWFSKGGKWLPSRDGCTVQLERLSELRDAIDAYLAQPPGEGLIQPARAA